MKKGMKIVRFIGIVCWFLALFILINGHQEKKKAAEEALFALCRKKPLLPKDFTSKAHIEKVTGIYVPFWLHDCYVNASLHAQGNRVSVRVRGDTERCL